MLWALTIIFTILWVVGMLGVWSLGVWTWLFCAGAVISLIGQFSRTNHTMPDRACNRLRPGIA
jgi:hypothetical protein